MSFNFKIFKSDLDEDFVQWLIENHYPQKYEHYGRLWDYYQNTSLPWDKAGVPLGKLNDLCRRYVQAQEAGLAARITGVNRWNTSLTSGAASQTQRKEIVIENDIAWRVNAMVDYLFGKSIAIVSKAGDPHKCAQIETLVNKVFAAAGGVEFFQNMAILGSIYGFVDCVVRADSLFDGRTSLTFDEAVDAVSSVDIDLVEAPRVLAILDESNYKKTKFYIQHFPQARNAVAKNGTFISRILGGKNSAGRVQTYITEIISPHFRQLYDDGELVEQNENPLGIIPVVHIQNIAQPCYYEGLSDVEPLVPLQDELNTRLSDRANRITMQSFKMYLAKGIEVGHDWEIMPGRMWCTDNEQAQICEFGGDASAPGEDTHIQEIREALDKVSGVTPVVAGVIRSKLGHLTSAVAMKMTLMGTLAKTQRKRLTYGEGIKQICRIVLTALDKSGVYKTSPMEREVEVRFPNPLPEEPAEKIAEAKMKLELGICKEKVLEELGY